jgi:hypothetical protein
LLVTCRELGPLYICEVLTYCTVIYIVNPVNTLHITSEGVQGGDLEKDIMLVLWFLKNTCTCICRSHVQSCAPHVKQDFLHVHVHVSANAHKSNESR